MNPNIFQIFYRSEVIFGLVIYFFMLNCLTLERISNSESRVSNLIFLTVLARSGFIKMVLASFVFTLVFTLSFIQF